MKTILKAVSKWEKERFLTEILKSYFWSIEGGTDELDVPVIQFNIMAIIYVLVLRAR